MLFQKTCVFEHEYYVPTRERGMDPDLEAEGYNVYKMIINENTKPRPDIKCILTGVVDGMFLKREKNWIGKNENEWLYMQGSPQCYKITGL